MKLLIAPIHYVIDSDEGSEYTRAYEYLVSLSKDKNLSGDVLVGFSRFKKIGNFIIHNLFTKKPKYISVLIRLKFLIWVFLKSKQLLKKNNYDLIWHHGPFAIGETFNLLLLTNKRIPSIIGPIFSPLTEGNNDAFGQFGKKSLKKSPKMVIKNRVEEFFYKFFSKIFSSAAYATLKKANKILTMDRVASDILKEKGIVNTEILTLTVIPGKYSVPSRILKKQNITLLTVGYFIERKRMIDVIETMKVLIQDKKFKNIKLLMVGDGPQENLLKNLVKEYNLSEFISFQGYVKRRNLASFYKKADVFISASTSETMAGMYFEAMNASLPMVIVENNTSLELKENHFGGFVIKKKNPKMIAEAVLKIIKNKNLYSELSRKNNYLMKNKYDFNKAIERLKSSFREQI